MTKTMSIRMDRDNYEFLRKLTKEEKGGRSKAIRELVDRGRIMLGVERYKKGEASLGKAADLAGVPVGQMMTLLAEYGVEGRLSRLSRSCHGEMRKIPAIFGVHSPNPDFILCAGNGCRRFAAFPSRLYRDS